MGNSDSYVQAFIYTRYTFLIVQNIMHVNSHLYKLDEMCIMT